MGKMGNPRCAVVGGGLDHVVNRKMYHTHGVPNTLSLRREKFPRMLCAHCGPEPTPSPSQEGSSTGWPVPLLGGVRVGWVAGRFMGREKTRRRKGSFRFVVYPAHCRRNALTRTNSLAAVHGARVGRRSVR